METTKAKPKKKQITLITHTAWLAVVDLAVILTYVLLLIKSQMTFTAEDYLAPIPIPMLIPLVSLVLLVVLLILTISQSRKSEKEDELSKLNRYKAGYFSKYICVVGIIISIWLIQDFHFAFSGDFMDNLRLPIIFIIFAQFVENIIFIILEKCNLE